MSARNFDNLPPHATNTVTISTSPQVRMAPSGQIRSFGVPMRPQPVPIRKIHHDGSGGTSTVASTSSAGGYTIHPMTTKEEADTLEFQGTSTSGPLLPGSSTTPINSFQQYQRGSSVGQSTSSMHNNGVGASMDQPAPVNLASKVAEVFLTAGHAFQKLGDLTLQLHTTTDADESKWSDKEVDSLRDALTRFAHELDQISTCVANRSTKHIKNDIKRRSLMDESNHQIKRMSMGIQGANVSPYTTLGPTLGPGTAMHSLPLGQKRVIQPTTKVVPTRAIVPTRYTMGPPPGSSILNGSTSGMPQLQQQGGSGIQGPRIGPRVAVQPTMVGKLTTTKRVLPSKPASGALVLDSNG